MAALELQLEIRGSAGTMPGLANGRGQWPIVNGKWQISETHISFDSFDSFSSSRSSIERIGQDGWDEREVDFSSAYLTGMDSHGHRRKFQVPNSKLQRNSESQVPSRGTGRRDWEDSHDLQCDFCGVPQTERKIEEKREEGIGPKGKECEFSRTRMRTTRRTIDEAYFLFASG